MKKIIRRGQIWVANIPFSKENSCIQQGRRPVVIISNEMNNANSPVVTVVTLTSRVKKKLPTHVILSTECGLERESMALCEQIMTIDVNDLIFEVAMCNDDKMSEIERALKIQTQLLKPFDNTYIDEVLFMIKESEREYTRAKRDIFKKYIESSIKELKRYCDEYGRDYKNYLPSSTELSIAI